MSKMEGWTIGKVDEMAASNPSLKKMVDKVKANQDSLAKWFFYLSCFYNFYTSPLLFVGGTTLGVLASASPFPLKMDSMQNGQILGRTKEDGWALQKVMTITATLNMYLGRTYLDDMFFGIFAGLLAGNSLYHGAKESTIMTGMKGAGDSLSKITELVLRKLPFFEQPAHTD